ncbi:MAG: glutamate-cysteine ligase family protein [Acidiferrobacterales bacterium]
MGQEIGQDHFNKHDFETFEVCVDDEMALLSEWFEQRAFDASDLTGGYEVEAWLIDKQYRPAPINRKFLEKIESDLVVPELSTFNIEINTTPQEMHGRALAKMHNELDQTWSRCRRVAGELGANMLMIGILPTVEPRHLTLDNISGMTRFRALNEQILRMRKGAPFELDISGRESLTVSHQNVMLEAATTSFQIHLKVSQEQSVRFFNASLIVSAPMVALTANSPYLFGRDLWDETRIPLFEQAVSVRSTRSRWSDRVTFGHGYAQESLLECFQENRSRFPVLLPEKGDAPRNQLGHLLLHNGTIWRWNRPLIGFSAEGTPHLRIEHRVASAGPSVIDTIANAAFYFGLVYSIANSETPAEDMLTFDQARTNFYAAANQGLNAHVDWMDGPRQPVQALLRGKLLPLAREGLERQEFANEDIEFYLGVIEQRLDAWCNGTAWQRGWVEQHGPDMPTLTAAYAERQQGGEPVHRWAL